MQAVASVWPIRYTPHCTENDRNGNDSARACDEPAENERIMIGRHSLVKTMKMRLAVVVCGMVSLASPGLILAMGSPAPQTQGQAAQKNWKDRDEYDLYTNITNPATTPQKKLDLLNQWTTKYPNTDFKSERATLFLTTYAQLGQGKDAVAAAKKILADNPKDFTALYYITLLAQQNADTSPEALDDAQKAANGLLGSLDEKFAAANKPPNATNDEWAKARSDVEFMARQTLGWVAMAKKDWQTAEQIYTKCLQMNPASGQSAYQLGTAIINEKDPAKYPLALFEFARAAAYDGPGALPAQARNGDKGVMAYFQKVYANYHGSADGAQDVLNAAKTSALPPAGWPGIKSAEDIEKEKLAAEQELAQKDPSLALWRNIRTALTGPDGENYFNTNMKGAQTPAFTGKLISAAPETKPKKLVLAIDYLNNPSAVGDCTVILDSPLPGKAEGDTIITFQGIPDSYTSNPFMVTFNAEKASIKGWTGKTEAPVHHAPVRRHPAAKK